MHRREFVCLASAAVLAAGLPSNKAQAEPAPALLKPMDLGLLISPFGAPEERIGRVRDLGFDIAFYRSMGI